MLWSSVLCTVGRVPGSFQMRRWFMKVQASDDAAPLGVATTRRHAEGPQRRARDRADGSPRTERSHRGLDAS